MIRSGVHHDVQDNERARRATTVMMCGLPASGKTTTAMRLYAQLGGDLIRSCDIYQELGIVLPEWVRRMRRSKLSCGLTSTRQSSRRAASRTGVMQRNEP